MTKFSLTITVLGTPVAKARLRENLARVQSDLPDAAPGDGLPLFALEADGHERR